MTDHKAYNVRFRGTMAYLGEGQRNHAFGVQLTARSPDEAVQNATRHIQHIVSRLTNLKAWVSEEGASDETVVDVESLEWGHPDSLDKRSPFYGCKFSEDGKLALKVGPLYARFLDPLTGEDLFYLGPDHFLFFLECLKSPKEDPA